MNPFHNRKWVRFFALVVQILICRSDELCRGDHWSSAVAKSQEQHLRTGGLLRLKSKNIIAYQGNMQHLRL